jgi:exodeoxyribonuclease-3
MLELSILTLNIGGASQSRAQRIEEWLERRHEDVLILTETRDSIGTRYLLEKFQSRGYMVIDQQLNNHNRGAAIVSRVSISKAHLPFVRPNISERVPSVELDTEPPVIIVGLYVPARSPHGYRIGRKQRFIESLLRSLSDTSFEVRSKMIIGGDYNVISRSHRPFHKDMLPFELNLIDEIESTGFINAFSKLEPAQQPYSWSDRAGLHYCLDYFHVSAELESRITSCAYLTETRQSGISDHSAVTLSILLSAPTAKHH